MRVQFLFLPPYNLGGVGVALVAGHPLHGSGILQVHPVPLSLHDVAFKDIAFGVGAVQGVHLVDALLASLVAVVGGILLATPDHEGRVSQVEQRHIAGVPGHH